MDVGAEDIEKERVLHKVVISLNLAPCFLLIINDKIVGIAGLTSNVLPWSGKATLCDYMFYIKPDYRSLSNFGGLVEACKKFSDEVGLPLRFEFISKNDEALRKRIYKMFGFEVSSVVGVYNYGR